MCVFGHMTETCIFFGYKFFVCFSGVIGDQTQLIKKHFGQLETDWIFVQNSHVWIVRQHYVGLNTDLQSFERDWDPGVSQLEQVRMVANFPQVHDDIHEVFDLLFMVRKRVQLFVADF